MTNTEQEARRRVWEACALIQSAYRLDAMNPAETLSLVRSAIAAGAEQMAEDLTEEAYAR